MGGMKKRAFILCYVEDKWSWWIVEKQGAVCKEGLGKGACKKYEIKYVCSVCVWGVVCGLCVCCIRDVKKICRVEDMKTYCVFVCVESV